MLCSPSSLTITATLFMSGRFRSLLMSVVLPLPRKPVTMLTGMRPASGSRPFAAGSVRRFMRMAFKPTPIPTFPLRGKESLFPPPQGEGQGGGGVLHIHLENIETAREAIDGVDDAALVHPHVVDLHRAGRRELG